MSMMGVPILVYSLFMKKTIVAIIVAILVAIGASQSSSAFSVDEDYITPAQCPRPFVAAFFGLNRTPLTASIRADYTVRADGTTTGIKLAPLVGEGTDINRSNVHWLNGGMRPQVRLAVSQQSFISRMNGSDDLTIAAL